MLRQLCLAPGTRFGAVGLMVTALHLAVFRLVSPWSAPEVANVLAFLLATQVNFALSYCWTWSSPRPGGQENIALVLRRAALFSGSALLSFGVNTAVFSTAYRTAGIPALESLVAAIAVSAAASYLLSSRIVFAGRPPLYAAGIAERQPARTGPLPQPVSGLRGN